MIKMFASELEDISLFNLMFYTFMVFADVVAKHKLLQCGICKDTITLFQ